LLIYDENTLDLSDIQFGVTSATSIINTIEANEICAALDALGVPIVAIQGGPDQRVAATDDVKLNDVKLNNAKHEIKLYPNPVVNNLNVDLPLLDNEVMNYNMVDLNGLSNGLYIITFQSNLRSFSKKVRVNH